jgi:glutamate-1-semialdehyde 2,1-aminomutase
MSAIRLARGFTGRSRIIKFEGCYHGHDDALLVKAGSGALTFGHPSSAGVPAETVGHTIVLDYNDISGIEATFNQFGQEIAAVIVEPVAGNMNLVTPTADFLTKLRSLCTQSGSVLIFDEVMTGFRVDLKCAQGLYQIKPDLTILGKVIGGGMPMAAFGGRREIMQCLAPLGPVYQAGTLSGNPVAVAAGLATLKQIQAPGFYEKLSNRTQQLVDGISASAKQYGIDFCAQSVGGMFGLYFRKEIPTSFAEVMQCNKESFNRFFHAMLNEGIYFAPSAFEAGFVSSVHGDNELSKTLSAADKIFKNW